jgi:hypothetical protein
MVSQKKKKLNLHKIIKYKKFIFFTLYFEIRSRIPYLVISSKTPYPAFLSITHWPINMLGEEEVNFPLRRRP